MKNTSIEKKSQTKHNSKEEKTFLVKYTDREK